MSSVLDRPLAKGTSQVALQRLFPKPNPYLHDPIGWVEDRLGEHLWSKQRQIAQSVVANRHTAVQSCHAAGKSHIASRLAAWWIDTHPVGEAFVVSTAPSGTQVKKVLWREIGKAHRLGGLKGRITEGEIPEWKIDGETVAFGRKPPDSTDDEKAMTAFQGIHAPFVLVILDEACGIPSWLWAAADTLVTGDHDRVLAIGNPDSPRSYFAKVCAQGSGWNRLKISAFETPRFTGEHVDERVPLITKAWVAEQIKLPAWHVGGPRYTAKVLGEFPESAVDQLITRKMLDRAYAADLSGNARGGYALDVGGDEEGADETCMYRSRGCGHDREPVQRQAGCGAVIRIAENPLDRSPASWSGLDTEDVADNADAILASHGADARDTPIVVDANGIGAGVHANLRHKNRRSLPFKAGESPLEGLRLVGDHAGALTQALAPEHFLNVRAQTFWALRVAMEAGLVDLDPEDEALGRQLLSLKYEMPNGKQIKIQSKDEMPESPDRADTAAMTLVLPATYRIELPETPASKPLSVDVTRGDLW